MGQQSRMNDILARMHEGCAEFAHKSQIDVTRLIKALSMNLQFQYDSILVHFCRGRLSPAASSLRTLLMPSLLQALRPEQQQHLNGMAGIRA